jgi:hypothetical protein
MAPSEDFEGTNTSSQAAGPNDTPHAHDQAAAVDHFAALLSQQRAEAAKWQRSAEKLDKELQLDKDRNRLSANVTFPMMTKLFIRHTELSHVEAEQCIKEMKVCSLLHFSQVDCPDTIYGAAIADHLASETLGSSLSRG